MIKTGAIVQCLGDRNGYDLDGKPANSTLLGRVKGFDRKGNIILSGIYDYPNKEMDNSKTLRLTPQIGKDIDTLSRNEPLYDAYKHAEEEKTSRR